MNLDVIVVTHNSAEHLSAALAALPGDARVVVVDNASSDASAEIAEAHGATVIRSEVNAGFATGCNRGAASGDAKTILFLNPDAVIEAEALGRLIDVFVDDPQVGVASPRLVQPDGSKQRVQWPYPSAAGAWREAFGVGRTNEESAHGFVVGAVFAVRREAFEAAGGFDERFWLYGEETDLCKRIEDLGWTIRWVPCAAATHIGGASGGDRPEGSRLVAEHFMRGGEHFVAKHAGRGSLVSYRAANLTGSLARGVLGVGARSGEHRLRAARLGRALVQAPSKVALDSPATAVAGKSLVVCSLEAWDDVWRRNQFFVRELLASDPDLRVLFVEPPVDVVHEAKRRSGRRRQAGLRPVDGEGRIVRFEPVKWLPRKVGPYADRWRDAQVLDAVAQLGFVQPTLWVNDPSYATLADQVTWPAVYDITDDWTEVADSAEAAKARAWEARLFQRCEAVTVCSPGLDVSRRGLRDDVVVVPNAVDVTHLRRLQPRPADLPAGPVAVYVGTLHTDRLDVDLTARLAREVDGLRVVLVGPDALDEVSRKRLDKAGVVRLGARPYGTVPGYLQHAEVIVVPHVVSPFTESLDPIKLYECLAVGTPTVATPVAGFRDAGGPVVTAQPSSFVDAVRRVLAEQPDPSPQQVASWADRAEAFADVLVGARSQSAGAAGRRHRSSSEDDNAGRLGMRGASRRSTKRLVVNARFRHRQVTGVERYARELTARLPDDVDQLEPDKRFDRPPLGHIWEQTVLPREIDTDEVLWSPCNTGPIVLKRHIVTIHDISPTEHPEWFSPAYARWLDLLAKRFVRHALHIITDSEFTKDRLCDRLGADADRVSIVHPGIDTAFFSGQASLNEEQRARLGVAEGPYLLSLATHEPRKNLAALINAFEIVHETHPDVTLVLAGDAGRSEIFARDDWNPSRGATAVNQIGYVPDELLPGLYGGAEALVYVPHYEGFGLPPVEAAAAGTQSVLADIPVLRELGLPATWVDPNDVESIAAGIAERLAGERVDLTAMQSVALGFSWDRSFESLRDAFAALGVDLGSAP